MIRRGAQPCRFQRRHHRPIGIRCEIGRSGLHHDFSARIKALRHHAVHRHGIKLAQREIGRVGQVDDNHVKTFGLMLQPLGGIVVDNADFRVVQRIFVQCGEPRGGLRHVRIQIDQGKLLDFWIFQHLARRQPVAAAQNQHALAAGRHLHGGNDQCFVVTGFITRRKLQIPVDIQTDIVFPLGNDQPLVGRVAFVHDRVAEIALFCLEHPIIGINKGHHQQHQHDKAAAGQCFVSGDFRAEDAGGDVRNSGVQDAEQQC